MILRRIFEKSTTGFYVDIGAHHPMRFSNTYFFYKQTWNGINIDAKPGSMALFKKIRPRDINLEFAISDKKEVLNYYIFNEPALNTFSKELAEERHGKDGYFIKSIVKIETVTLTEVLDRYLPVNQKIDFLSIYVEGLDYQVLKSIDFDKYKPKVILIEMLSSCLENVLNNEIVSFLKSKNYILFAKTFHTVVFIKHDIYYKIGK